MAKVQHDHVDHPLERLMFFSDAVFAIAITLLVIEIEVPHLRSIDPQESWHALGELLPSFGAYILSFAVIGRFWFAHHTALGVMERHTPKLMWPNILLLMVVAFMPFATAYFAKNLQNLGALEFYNMMLTLLAVASAYVVWIATAPENARPSLGEHERRTLRGRSIAVILVVLITLAASFFIRDGLSQLALGFMPLVQSIVIRRYTSKLEPVA